MRLGRLIIQICALVVAAAVIAGGYVYIRTNEVRRYAALLNPGPEQSIENIVGAIRSAPSMFCLEKGSDFYGAQTIERYYHAGKLYIRESDLTTREVTHYLVDESGYHVWGGGSDIILRIPNEIFRAYGSVEVDVLFRELTCSVWWNPDESLFDIPADRPLIDYQGAR